MDLALVSLIVLLAVCKPGLQSAMLGVCLHDDPFCTELAESETCKDRIAQHTARDDTEICTSDNHQTPVYRDNCDEINHMYTAFESFTCSNNSSSISQANWPILNYSLSYINQERFQVRIHWEASSKGDVSGYSLFITDQPWSYEQYEDVWVHCRITSIPRDSTELLYDYDYKAHDGPLHIFYIKLIPQGWCDGPQLSVEVPSCYSFCPGGCSACNYEDFVPMGPEILSASLCLNPDTNKSVASVVWETKSTYNGSYPYYVAMYSGGIFDLITRHIEVVGKTSVELHNLTLSPGQEYHVRVKSLECGKCGQSSKKAFLSSDSSKLCSIPTTSTTSTSSTSSTTTTPGPTTITLSTSSTTSNSINSTAPIDPSSTSSPTISTSTTSPTITTSTNNVTISSTQQTNSTTNDWLLFSLIFLTFAAAVFITIIIVACCLRRHSSTFQFRNDEKALLSLPPCKTKVLLVYSLRTSTEDVEYILENIVQPLRLYGIHVLFYDILYGQAGIPQWMERSVVQSSKVFLLYNSQFKEEWDREDSSVSPLEGNLVHILKQNFIAHVSMSSDYMSKYALLFSKSDSAKSTISSNYLYNLQKFVVDPQDPERLKQTVKFITNCKSYCVTAED